MKIPAILLFTALLLTPTSLAGAEEPELGPAERVRSIEHAHNAAVYEKQPAVRADFAVTFGPQPFEGTMWFDPAVGKVRMELTDGGVIVFDGKTAWLSPADAELPGPRARFHVLTWPYFAAAAYKLDDPGTTLHDAGVLSVRGTDDRHAGVKITFDAGVGDTPDDWYIAFADPQTNRLAALAYIVTYGKDQAEAEESPGIILYDDFVDIDGVPFSTQWTFHHWNGKDGIGERKGHATLSNIAFVEPADDAFVKPDGAVEAKKPGG